MRRFDPFLPSIRKITLPLVGRVIFFYSVEVVDRTRKGVGKTPVCPFEVTGFAGLEGGSPIERIRQPAESSSISLPPQQTYATR